MPLLAPQRLARTYAHPDDDPWEAVERYRRIQALPAGWGAARVAAELNADERDVRPWVDGDDAPAAARAVVVADEQGWLAEEWTATTRALARLTATSHACGTIDAETFRPGWSPAKPVVRSRLERDLVTAGTGCEQAVRPGSKPDEIRPSTHASVLGRALSTLDCPVGEGTAQATGSLPAFLGDAPAEVRADWLAQFVRERSFENGDALERTVRASHGRGYLERLADLVEAVTDESAIVSDGRVTLGAEAVRALELD